MNVIYELNITWRSRQFELLSALQLLLKRREELRGTSYEVRVTRYESRGVTSREELRVEV